jgi:sporulation protein YlmC with PRC-barrel domain
MEQPMSDTLAMNLAVTGSHYLYQDTNLPALADVENLRWKVLVDRDGEKIGTIESIQYDEDTLRVEFVEVGRGGFLGFGAERFLVPVTRILQVEEKTVQIDRPSKTLEGVPPYEPDRLGDADYCEGVRNWWCEDVSE